MRTFTVLADMQRVSADNLDLNQAKRIRLMKFRIEAGEVHDLTYASTGVARG